LPEYGEEAEELGKALVEKGMIDEETRIEMTELGKVIRKKGYTSADLSWLWDELLKAGWPADDRTRLYAFRFMGNFAKRGYSPQDFRSTLMKLGLPLPPEEYRRVPPQVPTAPLIICPNCHQQVPSTSKFCPNCGAAMAVAPTAMIICPKCNAQVPPTSKFCPECGWKIVQTAKCPKCGEEVSAGAKFCPNCGEKLK